MAAMKSSMTSTASMPAWAAASLSGDDWMNVVYLAAVLAFVSSGLVFSRTKMREHLGALVAWAGIAAVLVMVYAFRDEAGFIWQRFASALLPGQVTDTGSELMVERDRNGMFPVGASVNGVAVRFLFDTGASNVLLSHEDAKRVGFNLSSGDFRVPVSTANGETSAARIVLDEVVIGGVRRSRIDALVAKPGATDISLLGHSFLDTLKSYEVRGDRLIIRY